MQSTLDPVVFPRVTPEPGLPESAFTSFTVDKPFPSRAVDIGFVSHVVDGTLRFTGAEFLPIPLDPRSVLPPGLTVQRQHVDPGRVIPYAAGPEAAIRVFVDDEDTTVWLAAKSPKARMPWPARSGTSVPAPVSKVGSWPPCGGGGRGRRGAQSDPWLSTNGHRSNATIRLRPATCSEHWPVCAGRRVEGALSCGTGSPGR